PPERPELCPMIESAHQHTGKHQNVLTPVLTVLKPRRTTNPEESRLQHIQHTPYCNFRVRFLGSCIQFRSKVSTVSTLPNTCTHALGSGTVLNVLTNNQWWANHRSAEHQSATTGPPAPSPTWRRSHVPPPAPGARRDGHPRSLVR